MTYYITPPPQNPLTRIIAAIIALFALVGSLMIGMAALVVVAGVGLILGIVIWLRVAWIKRSLRKSNAEGNFAVKDTTQTGHIIDAEYTVITDSEDEHEK